MDDLIQEIEAYAVTNDVPIMQKEGIAFMSKFIFDHNVTRILEIGSAIGYSAICMAKLNENIHVITIERDLERYSKAEMYVAKAGLQQRVKLIYGDALMSEINGEFDLLFIDAAKSQYTRFFERYEPFLVQGGYIITDNLKFHGFVEHKELVTSRNLRQLVTKIQRFVDYLKQRDDYETEFLDIGDGVGISRKK